MRLAPPTESDEELLRLMLAGDEEAFVQLYRRWQGGIYRFALQMSGAETVAEDVTQEVFMALMREGERYDAARGSLAGYLYGIARNHVLRRMQRERSFVSLADESQDVETPAERFVAPDDPLANLAQREMIETVRQAVLSLPPHYREVIVLCELHEMSYAETATALGCAVGTVRSRLHRGRAMLVEKLRANGGSESDAASRKFNTAGCFA